MGILEGRFPEKHYRPGWARDIPMAITPWEVFRRTVLADPALQRELRGCADWPALVAAALRLAAERGLAVSADELEASAREGRRAWVERHL